MKTQSNFLLAFLIVNFLLPQSGFSQTDTLYCQTGTNSAGDYYSISSSVGDYGTCNNFNSKIQIVVLDSCNFNVWNTDSCIRYFGQLNFYSCINNHSTCA